MKYQCHNRCNNTAKHHHKNGHLHREEKAQADKGTRPTVCPSGPQRRNLPRVRARRYTREESIPAEEVIPVISQGECEPPTGNLKDAANYTQEGEDEDEEERPEIVMN